jgi:hypothetical protein
LVTANEVAQFMVKEVETGQYVYQEVMVYEIARQFGDEFTYYNANGNRAIGKDVLKEFRKLTKDSVVWMRGERAWRKRESHDAGGRQQDY